MKNKINSKKNRFIFIGTIISISLISLIFIIINFRDNIVFFYSPTEIINQVNQKIFPSKKIVRIGGMIKKGSIKKIDSLNINFVITDYQNELFVSYQGILPDLFREDQGVVAKGIYDSQQNIFIAQELLVKHDENYMPPEVAKNLKMKVIK